MWRSDIFRNSVSAQLGTETRLLVGKQLSHSTFATVQGMASD